jgi:hypothetical protein
MRLLDLPMRRFRRRQSVAALAGKIGRVIAQAGQNAPAARLNRGAEVLDIGTACPAEAAARMFRRWRAVLRPRNVSDHQRDEEETEYRDTLGCSGS